MSFRKMIFYRATSGVTDRPTINTPGVCHASRRTL
jgi:hypothetical protein